MAIVFTNMDELCNFKTQDALRRVFDGLPENPYMRGPTLNFVSCGVLVSFLGGFTGGQLTRHFYFLARQIKTLLLSSFFNLWIVYVYKWLYSDLYEMLYVSYKWRLVMAAKIKTRRVYLAQNDGYKDVENALTLLVLRIIQRAQADVAMGPARGKEHYLSAVVFFESEFYRLLLDYLSVAMADFEPDRLILPVGCE